MDGEDGVSRSERRLERRLGHLVARVHELERRLEAVAPEEAGAEAASPARLAVPLPPAPPDPRPPTPARPAAADVHVAAIQGEALGKPSPRWGWEAPAEPSPVEPAPTFDLRDLQAPPKTGLTFNLRDLEERFAGQALAWIGGFALVASAV